MSRTNAEVEDADLVHVAWHEAGHTVVSYLLGARSIELSIRDMVVDGVHVRGGITRKGNATNLWAGYFGAIDNIPVLLAGYFAERWVNPDRNTAREGAALDFERVRMVDPYSEGRKLQGSKWLEYMYPTRAAFRRFMLGQARLTVRLLTEHRQVVEVFAEALLARGELYPTEVNEMAENLIDRGAASVQGAERSAGGALRAGVAAPRGRREGVCEMETWR